MSPITPTHAKRAIYGLLAVSALALGSAAPSAAKVSSSIAGDSDFKIRAVAETSHEKVARTSRVSGSARIKFTARVLGIPMPVTGFYINSFPTIFKEPRLDAYDAKLATKKYTKIWDSWEGATQWMVKGQENFWGEKTVRIEGSAKGNKKGSGFFHAGTGSGHSIDANASIRVTLT